MSCCNGIILEGKLAEHDLTSMGHKHPISGFHWSRNTTAESSSSESSSSSPAPSLFEEQCSHAGALASACGRPTVTKAELEAMLAASVRDMDAAVTITCRSAQDGAPVICAVSRGFEEMCGWSARALVGGSGRLLEAEAHDCDPTAAAMSSLAHSHGAQALFVQTQRKASGELYAAFTYHRGLSMGSDMNTGDEMWFLVTVSFDITEDVEREIQGEAFVDHAFFEEAASSIASQVRINITDALLACSDRKGGAVEQAEREMHHCASTSDIEEDECCMREVSITTPTWVSCPPGSKLMTDTVLSVEDA